MGQITIHQKVVGQTCAFQDRIRSHKLGCRLLLNVVPLSQICMNFIYFSELNILPGPCSCYMKTLCTSISGRKNKVCDTLKMKFH